MKLSDQMQEWVRVKASEEIENLAKERDKKIDYVIVTETSAGVERHSIANRYIEFNQKAMDSLADAYLEAYRLEEKILDTDVIQGILAEIYYIRVNRLQHITEKFPDLGNELGRIEKEFNLSVQRTQNKLLQAKCVFARNVNTDSHLT